jgi:type II secretory pathway pseudopilin PulG
VLRLADKQFVSARLRSEEGFGLIELLISIVMLNVGILALVAAFNSGTFAIKRASQAATASTLAEKQMELYRAQVYANIALDNASKTTAAGNSIYAADTAYSATQETRTCGAPIPPECNAMRTVTGPDGASYRIDTYIVSVTPTNGNGTATGRAVKRVTVVARQATSMRTLSRLTSSFDEATA